MSPPLDEKYVTWENPQGGRPEKIPALHPRWKQTVQFVLYQPPPLDLSDTGAYEEWIERCSFLEDDLHWLLRQPHDKFWCQVIFDETLQRCIDSYLHHAPRSHDVYLELPADAKVKHQNIHRLFFMTCLRMATYKESKDSHLTPSVFGEILYENFIFDIPKVMDMCVLFGPANPPIVTKMVENIFEQQPKYKDDLRAVVPTVLEVFDNIQKKCGLQVETSFSPQKLTDGNGSRNLLTLPLSELQDLVLYLADTCATLSAFLDIYPKAAGTFSEEDFPIRLVMMYESLVPALTEAFAARDWGRSKLRPLLTRRLRQAQKHLLLVFRQVVFTTLLQPAIDNRDPEEVELAVESYVHLMTTILSERRFTAHYDHLFPFLEDQDLLAQTSYSIDETRVQFLEEGFSEARATYCSSHQKKKKKQTPDNSSRSQAEDGAAPSAAFGGTNDGPMAAAGAAFESPDYGEDYGACAPRITGIELESLITSVRDLLPDLGEGFIELCLEEFGYDVEKVINGVLEDKLPASLTGLDHALPRQTKPVTEEDVLSERANIYDNDEFDVFNRKDVDLSRIHKGKKEKGLDMSVLDHKEELTSVRPLFDRYGHEDVPSMYDKYEYDDEYDDTYDDNNIGADDADSADELRERRPFTVPRILAGGMSRNTQNDQEEDSEDEADAKPKDHFIEDPAKIRERQAQRRAAKQNHMSKRAPGQQPQGTGRFDVKGKPKGEGQDSVVVRNRAFKEKNKATRVHHNRKNLSDKKRKI